MLNQGTPNQAAAITATFSNTGVAAGTANRFQVLRMPAPSATIDMKPMYGNITRVITTALSKRSRPLASSQTSTGAPMTPITQVSTSAQTSTVAVASIRRCVTSSPSCTRLAPRIGTKACENAPSANSRRSRLGIRKATLKASVAAVAPKSAATNCSRTNPVTREARVSRETVDAALRRFMRARALSRKRPSSRRGRLALERSDVIDSPTSHCTTQTS